MPEYLFVCSVCKKEYAINMKMSEYSNDQKCECGEKLKRDIHNCCVNFGGNKDFFGKSK